MRSFRLAAALILAALVTPTVTAEEKPNPIAEQVKASLKDASKPFTLIVRLQVKEGGGEALETAFAKAAKLTRKENGCKTYEMSRDAKKPEQYLVYERWQDVPSLEAHLKSKHIAELLKDISELLAGTPEFQVLLPAAD